MTLSIRLKKSLAWVRSICEGKDRAENYHGSGLSRNETTLESYWNESDIGLVHVEKQRSSTFSLLSEITKQQRYDEYYSSVADLTSTLSHDPLIKVGSIIVRDGQIVSQGWNGSPAGMDNAMRDGSGRTHPYVIHSEANALMKLAKNGGGSDGAIIYCTHSPCYECAKLLLQAGIKRVVYTSVYDPASIEFLKERGLIVERIKRSGGVPDKQSK